MSTEYVLYNNKDPPFKVVVNNDILFVYRANKANEGNCVLKIQGEIFVGKSPKNKMTKFNHKYGHKFNGNSFLICNKNDCVYVGYEIFSFTSLDQINYYVSPIGNDDIPYPYAVDKSNNYYLFSENVVIKNNKKFKEQGYSDPYDYYYDDDLITSDYDVKNGYKIYNSYYIGDNQYILKHFVPLGEHCNRGELMYFKVVNNRKNIISREEFYKLIENFNVVMGYQTIKNKKTID